MGYIPLSDEKAPKLLEMLSRDAEFNSLTKDEKEKIIRVLSGKPEKSDVLSEKLSHIAFKCIS